MRMIEARGVSKRYKSQVVLKDFDFLAERGEFVLLVGANGSGKTTFLKGLLGLVRFDSGTFLLGSRKIAYVPEKFAFPEFVSLEEFLGLFVEGEVESLLEEWGLKERRKKDFRKLSKGMRQKALLLQALHQDAEILVFDEPLNGLDKVSVRKFLEELKRLKAEGRTILLCSHSPQIFKKLADRTVVMEAPE